MILMIPNIVQNLYLHLSMPFILGLHPPYSTSPTYPKPCYPNLPHPNPDPPPPLSNFFFLIFTKTLLLCSNLFFEFSQKLQFSVPIHPDPPTRPPLTRPPPQKKKNFFLNFQKSFTTSPFTSTLTPPNPNPPPPPDPPPIFFLNFHTSFTSLFPSTLTPPDPSPHPPPPKKKKKYFFFEFSQKLHFSIHIHPGPHLYAQASVGGIMFYKHHSSYYYY